MMNEKTNGETRIRWLPMGFTFDVQRLTFDPPEADKCLLAMASWTFIFFRSSWR